jgi:pyroglutamyl-peptidase
VDHVDLLITGFGPFLEVEDNPSARVACQVAGQLPGAHAEVLPASYRRSTEQLDQLIAEVQPSALLLLGLSRHVEVVRLEAIARNADRSTSPDVDDVVRAGRPVVADAPQQLAATADLSAIEQALADADVPFTGSTDAGGYVCNHLYFHALHGAARPTVFVHVGHLTPQTEPQVVRGVHAVAASILSSART